MSRNTFYLYVLMYLYGFSLMVWAGYLDKNPTNRSRKAARWGLFALSVTLIYFFTVLFFFGITD
ncbi:MAG: hypothetical protein ACK4HV_05505 [Parachlamydiaceae bacterium]